MVMTKYSVSNEGIDDPKGAHGRSMARLHPVNHATQPSSQRSLDDQPPREHLTTVRTATPRQRLASTMTQIEGQTNSPTSSGTKI